MAMPARLFLLAALLLVLAPALAQASARVVEVIDGDTVRVRMGAETVTVRLEGIDCPEATQPWAARARQFTARALGKAATVHPRTRDAYGRTVARIHVEGADLSLELLRAGLAWHFKRYNQEPELARLEAEARAARRGLWADRDPIPPWEWRNAPAASTGPYHGNVKSRVFHRKGCRNYECRNCTAVFATRQEAAARGFRPAGCCRP